MQNPQPVTQPDRASRRTFLGGSLTTALTVAAANGLATLPVGGAFASGDDRIRVGLIGCGGRGTGAAFQAAAADPGVQVVAMGDLFADQIASSAGLLTNLGSQFDCPMERRFVGTTAYQSVIDAGVDLVLLIGQLRAQSGHHCFMTPVRSLNALKSLLRSKQRIRKPPHCVSTSRRASGQSGLQVGPRSKSIACLGALLSPR